MTQSPSKPQSKPDPTREPAIQDWLMLGGLTLIGGSAFVFIKTAVSVAEPGVVSAVRLWVAALFLLAYTYSSGHSLPHFLNRNDGKISIDKRWQFMMGVGLIGYTIPFTLFPLAQQTLDSMLAGIYMAFMPLMTVIIAYFFANESLTLKKIAGFGLGTLGVIFLIGPAALRDIASSDVKAQVFLLIANLCYAVCAVMMRRAPEMTVRTFAAGTCLSSAVIATPLLILSGQNWELMTAKAWLSTLYLGIVPSGIASILIVNLIRKNGAGFMSMANYGTPVIAIIMGMLIFSEPLKPTFLIGLGFILCGLAITQAKQVTLPGRLFQRLIRPRK